MLKRYEEFLKWFDKKLEKYFEEQCEFVQCRLGCCTCCEVGDYPFSRLEAEYLMAGFIKLPNETKSLIREEIKRLKQINPKMYKCPFLIDGKCSVYQYRGIVCRVHGLAWFDEDVNKIRLPYCVNKGLNYSKVFDRESGEVFLQNPISENLRIDSILRSEKARQYELECGEIRSLIKWF